MENLRKRLNFEGGNGWKLNIRYSLFVITYICPKAYII